MSPPHTGLSDSSVGVRVTCSKTYNFSDLALFLDHSAMPTVAPDETDRQCACTEAVRALELSPFQQSSSLLAYAGDTTLTVLQIDFGKYSSIASINHLVDLHLGVRTQAIAWSPQASDAAGCFKIVLCAAGVDHIVRVYTDKEVTHALEGHTDYINAVAVHPSDTSGYIATVSDDRTCIVWDTQFGKVRKHVHSLASAGIGVSWHRAQLIVGEESGVVRFYNAAKGEALYALTFNAPLLSIDWNPQQELLGGAMADWTWGVFQAMEQVSSQGGAKGAQHLRPNTFKWARHTANTFAVAGSAACVRVVQLDASTGLQATVDHDYIQAHRVQAVAWHASRPWLVAADNATLRFWFVD